MLLYIPTLQIFFPIYDMLVRWKYDEAVKRCVDLIETFMYPLLNVSTSIYVRARVPNHSLPWSHSCALKLIADQNTSLWWNIDCGIDIIRVDGRFLWDTDLIYTQSGINAHINSTAQVLEEMKTLRFFPDGAQKNCYTLPVLGSQRHLIRAGFYYSNYDGLSSPPTFDLFLDGKKWSTVDTSTIEGPIYHEVVYMPRGSEFDLCLVQTKKEDVPFVSSIELVSLPSNFYSHLEGDYSFILLSRTNLGGDEIRYELVWISIFSYVIYLLKKT